MLRGRGALLAVLILALSFAAAVTAGAQVRGETGPESMAITQEAAVTVSADVEAAMPRLTRPPSAVRLPAIPSDPVKALISAANAHSKSLGFEVDHGPAIRGSGITPEYAGRLALLVQAVVACEAATEQQRLKCEVRVNDAAAGVLRAKAPSFRDVKAWPSLFVDGNGTNHFYAHDYSILIDRGGNDTYDNNAGGNLQDIKFGPRGSVAPQVGRAIGCEQVQGNFPAPTASGHDCIAAPQVVFIDQKSASAPSNDTYGVFKSPRTVDHNPPAAGPRRVDGDCTSDPLIRRIVTQGSGFEGNGLLIDNGGADTYLGKTAAQGSGHGVGVGVLRDLGRGNDRYVAIRNSQGFSLVGILGLAQDDGGHDRYRTYMPSPRKPSAEFQKNGSGGVVDDTGLCDNLPRMVQGAALLGGVGHLLNQDGRDLYVGAPVGTQPFQPLIEFYHSSQGFGCDGGVGILDDRGADDDTYREGPRGRKDGVSISEPETDCFAAPGLNVFRDDGP